MNKLLTILAISFALILLNCSKPKPETVAKIKTSNTLSTQDIIDQINATETYFDFDQSSLSHDNRDALKKINKLLSEENASNLSISIEGHTDAVGTVSYNLALGESRAQTALSYLVQLGLNQSTLNAISYGEESLKINTDEREPLNRRVSFSTSSK